MPPKKEKAIQSTIRVKRTPGTGCALTMKFEFDPEKFGAENTQEFWSRIGALLAHYLSPDQREEFLRQFRAQLDKPAA